MTYHNLFSKKNIKAYNEDIHEASGLTGKEWLTLDESEIEDFKKWVLRNCPEQNFKITVEYHQSIEKNRQSSFWYNGHVATVTNGLITLNIMATGMLSGSLDEDGEVLDREELVKEAKNRGYTDKDIDALKSRDMLRDCNWFNLEVVTFNLVGSDEYESLERTIDSIKVAVFEATEYIKELKELKSLPE